MIKDYEKNKIKNEETTVLIAPSWQKDNIVDICLDKILDSLKGKDYKVIVRPHPQHVRHMKDKFEKMKEEYRNNKNIEIQTDFSSNNTVFNADLMISDWSGIALEYAYTTKKPVLYIDTPMKIMNPEYTKISVEPINIWSRKELGEVITIEECKNIDKVVEKMLKEREKYSEKIDKLVKETVYNLGNSAEVGANYIISAVQNKINEKKRKE